VRGFANIADDLEAAGYSATDISRIKKDIDRNLKLRDIIRHASGESLDLKAYEADMRHLIDTYIEADEPRKISPFDDVSLMELIVKSGISTAINNQLAGIKSNKDAVAETIENNVRSVTPAVATALVASYWKPVLSGIFRSAERAGKEDVILYVRGSALMSAAWNLESHRFAGAPHIGKFTPSSINLVLQWLEDDRVAPRVCIVNLSARLRVLNKSLAGARELVRSE
jgi:hypothetical protein